MKLERVKVKSLKHDPVNARKHSERNIEAIRGSLDVFGQQRPLVVWQGIVIAGNGTLQAAKELDWDEIEIVRAPDAWSSDEARAYSLADNRTSELAEWDDKLLADQLLELDSVGFDIGDWGFSTLVPPLDPEPPNDPFVKAVTCPDCGLEFVPNN